MDFGAAMSLFPFRRITASTFTTHTLRGNIGEGLATKMKAKTWRSVCLRRRHQLRATSLASNLYPILFMTVVRHGRIIGLFEKMPRSAFGAVETVRISKIESRLGTRTHDTATGDDKTNDDCVMKWE